MHNMKIKEELAASILLFLFAIIIVTETAGGIKNPLICIAGIILHGREIYQYQSTKLYKKAKLNANYIIRLLTEAEIFPEDHPELKATIYNKKINIEAKHGVIMIPCKELPKLVKYISSPKTLEVLFSLKTITLKTKHDS